ncbi:MAG: hypothetical protein CME26_06415 [Gemmatimonadetes bacterium]|nr:hypothetical protein [Gemmatimonadota bacterium]|tara:strand:- start:1142 stop:1789 length:648 start_codon:yes stop_codon:yes gene_type:complete
MPVWQPLEADAETIASNYPEPLMALADGVVPAFVLRGAFPAADCNALMGRFEDRGYFNPDTVGVESQLSGGSYLDLGTSLGRMGKDREAFFAHAEGTHALFSGLADPVETIYRNLSTIAGGILGFCSTMKNSRIASSGAGSAALSFESIIDLRAYMSPRNAAVVNSEGSTEPASSNARIVEVSGVASAISRIASVVLFLFGASSIDRRNQPNASW